MSTAPPDHVDAPDLSTSEALLVEPSALSPARRAFNTVVRSREFSVFLVLVAVVAVATIKSSSFLFNGDGWRNFLVNPSLLVILAVLIVSVPAGIMTGRRVTVEEEWERRHGRW